MSFESGPSKNEEFITPEELNEFGKWLQEYLSQVGPKGGNDVEFGNVQTALDALLSGNIKTKTNLAKWKGFVGHPDEKNSDYH
jgi:hypothetical protein